MQDVAAPPQSFFWSFLTSGRERRLAEERMARENPHLMTALEIEKHEGLRIAVQARTLALCVIAVLLPVLNPTLSVLYYEALLLAFMGLGWLQLRFGRVGLSRFELVLIFVDLSLLTFTVLVPNPLLPEEIPNAFGYRFDNFIYFFVLLAAGTLAYSWRTVIAIGTWTAGLWLAGLAWIYWFGHTMPELGEPVRTAFAGSPVMARYMDPNDPLVNLRIQEIVVFVIVAAILALRGFRTNQLILRESQVAAERANLSRYFPQNLVEVLASSAHDIGAERTQEIAVLFADIVGFTEIAERNPPAKVMELLRRYHSVLENAIFSHGGTLDKYLGDGVMATFGTPSVSPRDAANALAAARQIIADMDECSRQCVERGDPGFKVSVGVHFGPVILGDIGPQRRLEFAVVGDTVNVAARLEAATRNLGCRLIASHQLIEKLRDENDPDQAVAGMERRPSLKLRGRDTPIDTWIA